ncbi:hypothetical protein [Lactiplantibacillus plantarum]|uniref:hypothetical protein n=1 Tax=Lactiplantibacillus plantarum TaxID=1590 RepID=UPI00214B3F9B|nr:hypothetical protein [Lactiplantibacillus plantarum]
MSILKTTGANISYTAIGNGPILILIPGANGTGDIFYWCRSIFTTSFHRRHLRPTRAMVTVS